ncbi:hypothetical protein ACX0MV_20135 [Pseudomonas borbori]
MNTKIIAAIAFFILTSLNIYTLNQVSSLKTEIQATRVEVINVYDSLGYYAEGQIANFGPDTVSGGVKEINRKLTNLCQKLNCN